MTEPPLRLFGAYAGIWALVLTVPAARHVVIQQFRSFDGYSPHLWLGLLSGCSLVLVNAFLLIVLNVYGFGQPGFTVFAVMVTLGWAITVATTEEMMLRGLLLRRLQDFSGANIAVVATALIFAVMHVGRTDFSIWSVLQYLADGLLLGWITVRSGSIWSATALHSGKNLLVALVFGGSRAWVQPFLVTKPMNLSPTDMATIDLATYLAVFPLAIVLFASAFRSLPRQSGS